MINKLEEIINPDVVLKQSVDVMENPIIMRPFDTDLYNGLVDLAKEIAKSKPKLMVEIGSYNGESLQIFRENLPEDCQIICIDPWENNYDATDPASEFTQMMTVESIFDKMFRQYKNVGKLKFYSYEVASMFADGSIDVLYIDGSHKYEIVKSDILKFLPKISKDGIISGHDYFIELDTFNPLFFQERETSLNIRREVRAACAETIGVPDMTFKDTSWLKFKRNIAGV